MAIKSSNKGGYYHPHNRVASKFMLQAAYRRNRPRLEITANKQEEIPEVLEDSGHQTLLHNPPKLDLSNGTEKRRKPPIKKEINKNQPSTFVESELPLKIEPSTLPPRSLYSLRPSEFEDSMIQRRLDFLLTIPTVTGLGKHRLKRLRQVRERRWFGPIKERLVDEIASELSAISYCTKLTEVLNHCLIYKEDRHFHEAMHELIVLFSHLQRKFPKHLRHRIETEADAQLELFRKTND